MKKPQKNPKHFCCKKCGFTSRNKKDYTRHLSTTKHKMDNMDNTKSNAKNPRPAFECVCSKLYKYNSGLSKHRKKCTLNSNEENIDNIETAAASSSTSVSAEMLNKLVEQNNTLMEKVIELSKDRQIINYQDCGNKKMTINVFLNQECKNAMNLTDFVENVKVSLEDLKYTKEHGYIKGISNIFAKNLQDLDPKERPIHCSDKKRLQFYVKEEDKWEKDMANAKINKTIEDITVKQIKRIKEWERKHPDYLKDDRLLQEWHRMIQQITGSGNDEELERSKEQIKKSLGNTIEIKDAMVIDN
uniref:C2H2-type domain-containing protein n=1 Tax=viral metagenome TaxID=1070528 RepID=A0A6C0EPT9_9ZZZZ